MLTVNNHWSCGQSLWCSLVGMGHLKTGLAAVTEMLTSWGSLTIAQRVILAQFIHWLNIFPLLMDLLLNELVRENNKYGVNWNGKNKTIILLTRIVKQLLISQNVDYISLLGNFLINVHILILCNYYDWNITFRYFGQN